MKYNEKVLRKLQLVELEILEEVVRVCQKYNITYQLFSGTLLGAIRHKGFIPWNDDIDIVLLREDYNKLIDYLKIELNSKYFLQTIETDKNYVHPFARVRKNNTVAIQEHYAKINMHHGIFIDIFPLDYYNDKKMIGKIHLKLLYFFRKLKFLKISTINQKTFKSPFKNLIMFFISLIPLRIIVKTEDKLIKCFKKKKEFSISLLAESERDVLDLYKTNKSVFLKVIKIEFEGSDFLGPINYDEVLNKIFGDYQKLPPISDRHPHHRIKEITFNEKLKKKEELIV